MLAHFIERKYIMFIVYKINGFTCSLGLLFPLSINFDALKQIGEGIKKILYKNNLKTVDPL